MDFETFPDQLSSNYSEGHPCFGVSMSFSPGFVREACTSVLEPTDQELWSLVLLRAVEGSDSTRALRFKEIHIYLKMWVLLYGMYFL